ncbi:MAG: hypothetical protein Tsb0021_16390 [Chlamydiales bacterium]
MRILFTGSSSFTGMWFVQELLNRGHSLTLTLTKPLNSYTGIRKERIQRIKERCVLLEECRFGDAQFLEHLSSQSFDLLCHHGAEVTQYKSPSFPVIDALRQNTYNLESVLEFFPRIILTGTVFEQNEGLNPSSAHAFSPYGLSKGLTYELFRFFCHQKKISLGKFVIPNPFGPYEEEKFTHYLMRTWSEGNVTEVKTPDYVRDNIHVSLLAKYYADFTESNSIVCCPRGYAETQAMFTKRLAKEVSSRTGWECQYKINTQTTFTEPIERINAGIVQREVFDWDEVIAWDHYVNYYCEKFEPLRIAREKQYV